jgi:hypothetical protein
MVDINSQCTFNPPGPLDPLPHHTTCAPAMDDEESDVIGPFVPWNYRPWCVQPTSHNETDNTDGNNKKRDPKLCVYTVTSLRGQAGMSIVTTPDVAASIANELQDPDIAWLEKERGVPFSITSPSSSSKGKAAYRIAEVEGKGLGVLATREIKEGEILMFGPPILVRMAEYAVKWPSSGAFMSLQHASTRLPTREKELLLSLAKSGEGYVVDDVMNTNAFQMTVGDEAVEHSGLFPEIAVSFFFFSILFFLFISPVCLFPLFSFSCISYPLYGPFPLSLSSS